MKAYTIGDQQGIKSLSRVEIDEPKCKGDEAIIKFHAHSLNYRDYMILNQWYGDIKPESRIPLSDGAGEVVEIGENVEHLKVGDRVCINFFSGWLDGPIHPKYFSSDLGGSTNGTLAEYGAYPAKGIVKLPDTFSFSEGACLPCAGVTAWNTIVEAGQITPDSNILLLGTGGVSVFGVQIAKAMGATAIITSSSNEKLEELKAIGADHCINYKEHENWASKVLEATNGAGANIAIETGGPKSMAQTFEAMSFNGLIGLIGFLSGNATEPLDMMPLIGKNINLRGVAVGSTNMLQKLISFMDKNGIKPYISKEFAFDDAKAAFYYMESQSHIGKIVINHK
jgi:NADPH:quinone reductase-like Zn-dependent oxidoreductase